MSLPPCYICSTTLLYFRDNIVADQFGLGHISERNVKIMVLRNNKSLPDSVNDEEIKPQLLSNIITLERLPSMILKHLYCFLRKRGDSLGVSIGVIKMDQKLIMPI
jgi:hypothetical protein